MAQVPEVAPAHEDGETDLQEGADKSDENGSQECQADPYPTPEHLLLGSDDENIMDDYLRSDLRSLAGLADSPDHYLSADPYQCFSLGMSPLCRAFSASPLGKQDDPSKVHVAPKQYILNLLAVLCLHVCNSSFMATIDP